MRKALICGVSGQDGAYLAKLLLEKGYEVFGSSRDAQTNSFTNLLKLGIRNEVRTVSMALTDFRSVLQVIKMVEPLEVYNLAGQTSVGLSFDQPVETFESIVNGTINILEAMRFVNPEIRFFNSASSECFGNSMAKQPATETTLFHPRSPYAVAKAAAFWQTVNYREAYQLHASSGILFNHESPLRPDRFVTQKIISAAKRIAEGSNERLQLGNINIRRDWGWAPEYVEAMYQMLQQDSGNDFIIATGKDYSLRDFLDVAFEAVGLIWEEYVDVNKAFFRPSDLDVSIGNPEKIFHQLGWSSSQKMPEVIGKMINSEI